ncbi:hypothetical protein [Roseateles sp. MS654]|uniref:hypothetical protein n=1 Tax=Roseateles sp. MS654 TaxID=3412685 RepID=UPI003C30CB74
MVITFPWSLTITTASFPVIMKRRPLCPVMLSGFLTASSIAPGEASRTTNVRNAFARQPVALELAAKHALEISCPARLTAFHCDRGMPAASSAWAERVLRISLLPSRTMKSIGISDGFIAPDQRAAATSSTLLPANAPPLLNMEPKVFCA